MRIIFGIAVRFGSGFSDRFRSVLGDRFRNGIV